MTKWPFFMFTCLLFSCTPKQIKEDLCHTWRYDVSSIRKEMVQKEADFAAISYMESIMGGLQYARLRFSPDGKVEFRMDDLIQSGRWKLRNKGTELVLQMTDQEQVHQIVRLNADTLVLEPMSGDGPSFPRILLQESATSDSVQ